MGLPGGSARGQPPTPSQINLVGTLDMYFRRRDDTEPSPVSAKDTQPVQRVSGFRARYGLIVLIALGLLGMVFITGSALFLIAQPDQAREPVRVELSVDGITYQTTTDALTVADLLEAEGIAIGDNTTISPLSSTAIEAGMRITVDQQRLVTLTVDGLTSVFYTIIDNPLDILTDAGITIGSADIVRVNGSQVAVEQLPDWPLPANRIEVQHAVLLRFEVDGETREIVTSATTVGDALIEADIELYLADTVMPPLDTLITEGLTVRITRSQPITVTVDDVRTELRTQAKTVNDAMIEAGIALHGLDYTVPSASARLRPGMEIRVVRVTEEILTEREAVPYQTVFQADETLELDQRATLQNGQNGVLETAIRVRYENGVEVRRDNEGSEIVQEPVNAIIGYGTKVVLRTLDTPDGPVQYWRKLRMIATSYHPAALGGDDITATGARLTKGIVAIDPRVIAYGTQLYVPGYGVGEAADTGGPRSTRYWIDLGYDDENYQSWSRWTDVYILGPIPDNITYLLP